MAIKLLVPGQNKLVVDAMATLGSLKLFTLTIVSTTVTTTKYQTLWRDGAAYQVDPAKTGWITRIVMCGGAGGSIGKIGYGSAAVNNSASAPAGDTVVGDQLIQLTASVIYDMPLWFRIPASQFPYIQMGGTFANFTMWAFEE